MKRRGYIGKELAGEIRSRRRRDWREWLGKRMQGIWRSLNVGPKVWWQVAVFLCRQKDYKAANILPYSSSWSYSERASPSRANTISFLRRVISQYTSWTKNVHKIMSPMCVWQRVKLCRDVFLTQELWMRWGELILEYYHIIKPLYAIRWGPGQIIWSLFRNNIHDLKFVDYI